VSESARSGHPRAASWRPRGGREPRGRDHATPLRAAGHPPGASPDAAQTRGFRLDIQGLRAIAVTLVLAFHLWPELVTGGYVGVDAFFVISGFLITAHLLEHPPRRTRDLLEFWGRRIRRLLPAALLVLAATALASRLLAPETRWAATAGEIIASALYVQNWALAGSSVDYLAAEEPPTPVQHYWSLSVEEQFYVVWPVLLLAAFWAIRRWNLRAAATARLVMLVVAVGSLLYSVSATAAEPASAYFVTPTRMWELAIGGCIATLPPIPAWAGSGGRRAWALASDGLAWAGIAMVLLAGVAFTPETPFPGSAALLPVLGTGLAILAASEGRWSPTRILRWRPIQHIGDTSYSIYLWHWPLIVLWPDVFDEITPLGAAAIIALTLGLATLSKVYVEDAVRFRPSFQPVRVTFRLAVVGMLVVSLMGGAQLFEATVRLDQALATAAGDPGDDGDPGDESGTPGVPAGATATPGTDTGDATPAPDASDPAVGSPGIQTCTGAASIVRGFDACPQDPAGKMVPSPIAAATDRSDAYPDGCFNYAPFGSRRTCTYGNGPIKVALVGNSHAGQWLPAMQALAKRNGWTVTTYIASQCNVTDAALEFYSAAKTQGCLDWGQWVMSRTRGDAYDLVVISERQSVPTDNDGWDGTRAVAEAGFTAYLRRWSDAGTNVAVLQDTPYPGKTLGSVPDCLARHAKNQLACAGTPDSWRPMDPLFSAALATPMPGITPIDARRFLCTDTICPAVIGTLIAYFDASHMTATYARSIAPYIEAELLALLPGAPTTP
jgi:peptidoglycan/LPS O-acetylase OafA/YrhL